MATDRAFDLVMGGCWLAVVAALVIAIVDFGRDNSCTTSLKTGRFVTGARLVAEAMFRRITTPRGLLRGGEDEQNYGIDISALVGSVRSEAEAASLPGRIKAELEKDERLLDVSVSVETVTEAARVTYKIAIDGETSAGPFQLVVLASAVTVELLHIAPEVG